MKRKIILISLLVITLLTTIFAPAYSQESIVDIALADTANFSTLVAALTAADLVETLSGPGPFTVFAPTNDAFDDLPEGVLDNLLSNIPALTEVLLYHVSTDALTLNDLTDAGGISTLQGGSLTITGTAKINNADIIIPDIQASNGIIHVINQVLVPQQIFDPTNDATIIILPSSGGTTNPNPGSYIYSDGTTITLNAIPNEGFEFLYWVASGDFTPGTEIRDPNVIVDGEFVFIPPVEFTGSDSLIFTNNPARITCGFGYTYRYQPVFTPIIAGIEPPVPVIIIGEDITDPLDTFQTIPTLSETTFVSISTTFGGTTNPAPGRYAFPTHEPNFQLTAIPETGFEFSNWVVTGDYMPTHGGDPSLDTNVIPNNPLPVTHGLGYTYNYEAVFTPIDTNGQPDGTGTTETHPFGLSNDAITALLIILIIAVIAAVAFGLYAYNRKK